MIESIIEALIGVLLVIAGGNLCISIGREYGTFDAFVLHALNVLTNRTND